MTGYDIYLSAHAPPRSVLLLSFSHFMIKLPEPLRQRRSPPPTLFDLRSYYLGEALLS